MPKLKLSNDLIKAARCPAGKKKIDPWDELTTGFIAEIRASGKVTFYLRYLEQSGRQRQVKLGCYGDISFEQARKAAQRLRSEVVLGGDPAGKKAETKAIPTYAALAAQHLAHAKAHLRRPEGIERILRCHLVPRWGKLRLNEIKSQDIALWLGGKAED